jgi:signal transduction histidine kinase
VPESEPEATILVAEDDPELRAALARLLSATYRVICAGDGLEALALAQKHLPDLLVTDVGMPGMDGFELTARFRQMSPNRLAPVILLTAHADLHHRVQGLEAGAVDYITKPFQPVELLARVRAQLMERNLALKLHESEKLAALGTLAAGLTHEIRNPANGVVNAVQPLRELLPAALLEPGTPTAELLDVISGCAEQIATLSRQLLGFVRQGELVCSEALLEDVVDRAVALAQPALKSVHFERRLDYRGPLRCSPSLLAQVLMNLLENAVHASGADGRVTLSARTSDGRLLLEVSDNGPGVPAAARNHIFEPFFTTKAPGAGTGLGLSTSRMVVERHQGTLTLVSGSGPGATFRVDIPLCRAGGETLS